MGRAPALADIPVNENPRERMTHMKLGRIALLGAIATLGMTGASALLAHGDVTPQAVDTSALPEIGEAWLEKKPL